MTLVQHTSKSQEHHTPSFIIEPSRVLMGGIDLDPASCAIANERVKAKKFWTKEDGDVLHPSVPWEYAYFPDEDEDPEMRLKSKPAKVFLNPPGGKAKGVPSLQKAFWQKLVDQWAHGYVEQAVFLAFSIELLQTSQNGCNNPHAWCTSYPFCIPRKRISYIDAGGNSQKSPPNASAIIFLPPRKGDVDEKCREFVRLFSSIGAVVVPSPVL